MLDLTLVLRNKATILVIIKRKNVYISLLMLKLQLNKLYIKIMNGYVSEMAGLKYIRKWVAC